MDNRKSFKSTNPFRKTLDLSTIKKSFHSHHISVPLKTFSELSTPKNTRMSMISFENIEKMLKKIDPNFQMFSTNESPSDQMFHCIAQAVQCIIEQRKLETCDDSSICSLDGFESVVCEHCGRHSQQISDYQNKLYLENIKINKKIKNYEKTKFIQVEKVKQEKKVLLEARDKLDFLAKKITGEKDAIFEEFEKQKKNKNFVQKTENDINIFPKAQNISNPPNQSKNYSKTQKNLKLEKFTIFHLENSLDFTSLVEDIDNQILVFNQEISKKEDSLAEREKQLEILETQVKKQLNDIELMSLSLDNSKNEFLDLKTEIFPELEYESELLKQLVDELNKKKEKFTSHYSRFIVSPNDSDKKQADIEKMQKELEIKNKENCEFADYLIKLQKKLDLYYENKNKELKTNEEELARLHEKVNYTIDLITKKEKELNLISESLKEKERLIGIRNDEDKYAKSSFDGFSPKPKTFHNKNKSQFINLNRIF